MLKEFDGNVKDCKRGSKDFQVEPGKRERRKSRSHAFELSLGGEELRIAYLIFESPAHRATPTRGVNRMWFQSSKWIRNRQVPAYRWTM